MPPETYLRDWSRRNRGLAEGLLLYEAGLGPHGIPMHRALDDDMDGWFEVEERTDYAQQALDEWRKEQRDIAPGVFPVVIDTRKPDGKPRRRQST